jgi:hypothetical protein
MVIIGVIYTMFSTSGNVAEYKPLSVADYLSHNHVAKMQLADDIDDLLDEDDEDDFLEGEEDDVDEWSGSQDEVMVKAQRESGAVFNEVSQGNLFYVVQSNIVKPVDWNTINMNIEHDKIGQIGKSDIFGSLIKAGIKTAVKMYCFGCFADLSHNVFATMLGRSSNDNWITKQLVNNLDSKVQNLVAKKSKQTTIGNETLKQTIVSDQQKIKKLEAFQNRYSNDDRFKKKIKQLKKRIKAMKNMLRRRAMKKIATVHPKFSYANLVANHYHNAIRTNFIAKNTGNMVAYLTSQKKNNDDEDDNESMRSVRIDEQKRIAAMNFSIYPNQVDVASYDRGESGGLFFSERNSAYSAPEVQVNSPEPFIGVTADMLNGTSQPDAAVNNVATSSGEVVNNEVVNLMSSDYNIFDDLSSINSVNDGNKENTLVADDKVEQPSYIKDNRHFAESENVYDLNTKYHDYHVAATHAMGSAEYVPAAYLIDGVDSFVAQGEQHRANHMNIDIMSI